VFDNEPWNIDVRISWWSNLAEKLERFVLPGSTPPQYPPSFVARCHRPRTEGARLAGAFDWACGTRAFNLRRVVSGFYDISSEAIAC
jgi:hypothetical protein